LHPCLFLSICLYACHNEEGFVCVSVCAKSVRCSRLLISAAELGMENTERELENTELESQLPPNLDATPSGTTARASGQASGQETPQPEPQAKRHCPDPRQASPQAEALSHCPSQRHLRHSCNNSVLVHSRVLKCIVEVNH